MTWCTLRWLQIRPRNPPTKPTSLCPPAQTPISGWAWGIVRLGRGPFFLSFFLWSWKPKSCFFPFARRCFLGWERVNDAVYARATWLIRMCDMTYSLWRASIVYASHSYVWYDSCIWHADIARSWGLSWGPSLNFPFSLRTRQIQPSSKRYKILTRRFRTGKRREHLPNNLAFFEMLRKNICQY